MNNKEKKSIPIKVSKIIPEQHLGGHSGVLEIVEGIDLMQASIIFNSAKSRMKDINNWKNICEGISADFHLTDKNGNLIERLPMVGDHIRIDLPGPGSSIGDGYDWVYIESIEEFGNHLSDDEMYTFRVHPSNNPLSSKLETAHLYKNIATSSFILYRQGLKVYALQEGRNELPNIDIDNTKDKVRNSVVAFGALLGFSMPQWKKLVYGILNSKK